MTASPIAPDFTAIKARQQQTWASGDFSVIASRIVLTSERLAEAADLRAGSLVLDVACGSGNAAIAAARHGTRVIGVDYVPELLEDGRARAEVEGLDVEFQLGDAEDLPLDDNSVDAVLSVYGSMFAPDHERTASEMVRVARPGATVALASWTPTGFIGEMFTVISAHVPPPAGVQSPMLWGTEDHLMQLFGSAAVDIASTEQTQSFRYRSADEFVEFFRRWYGPTHKAFAALDEDGQQKLHADLGALARRWDTNQDGGAITVQAEYLQSVITLR
ncbi:MAG TPA: class I SAM-dependent methyltransferase [Actinomycetes bacterium]|nr:class I SAM-dependent methyltransferase [Actinomycetes bacterium]